MGPLSGEAELARPYFKKTRELFEQIKKDNLPNSEIQCAFDGDERQLSGGNRRGGNHGAHRYTALWSAHLKYDKICLNYAIIESCKALSINYFSPRNILYYNFMGIVMRQSARIITVPKEKFFTKIIMMEIIQVFVEFSAISRVLTGQSEFPLNLKKGASIADADRGARKKISAAVWADH